MEPCSLACLGAVLGSIVLAAGTEARWATFSQPGWQSGQKPGEDTQISVILALRQRNLAFLEERAQRVSDPSSPEYGQYLSHSEVSALAGPSEEAVMVVKDFLDGASGGHYRFSKAHDFAIFYCSITCTERLFSTTLLLQHGPQSPPVSRIRAATPISLPISVSSVLDGISLNAPILMPRRPKPFVLTPFLYPASGRLAPRIDPLLVAGDGFLMLRFVAYCANGEVNRDRLEQGVCSSSGERPTRIVSFEILVVQEPSVQKVVSMPAVPLVLGQRAGNCGQQVGCVEFNATLGSILNYMTTRVVIRAFFNDGSVTDFSNPTEVRPVWPLPYTTPDFLSRHYNMPLNMPVQHPRNAISVAEFLGQYYNPADLETFFRVMGIQSWPQTAQPWTLGPDVPQTGSVLGGEAQLDLQYIMAMAANVSTWFWSVPGKELATTQEPFLQWLFEVADHNETTAPLVHSVSYIDDEESVPVWFQRRVDVEFMKLALRGVSVLVASGDDGASGYRIRHGNTQFCNRARPGFPASSPWVTSVGGTQLSNVASPVCGYTSDSMVVNCREEGEVACSSDRGGLITTGGGFSNTFPMPWYQREAVGKYLRQADSPLPAAEDPWQFNRSGRAYPDISAVANNYLIWMGDGLESTAGTSASTPLIAAMVAHWNELRLQRGEPQLGFLNPLLYTLAKAHPDAFNDVIIGDNRCGISECCERGFGAARGWDATTGIGSPKFDKVTELLRLRVPSAGVASLSSCMAATPRPAPWPVWMGAVILAGVTTMGCAFVVKTRRRGNAGTHALHKGLLERT